MWKEEEQLEKMRGLFKNGYGYIPKSVMRCKDLSIQAKAIYSYLISFAGRKDCAYPSRRLMCYDLQISQDTLNKYIKELVKIGLIYKRQTRKDGSKFSNNEYYFCFTKDMESMLAKASISENIVEKVQEDSVTENIVAEKSVTDGLVSNSNKNNNNNSNNNSNTNGNINKNSINNNNKESENSLQFFKSITNKYINDNDIIELVNSFIELKQKSQKPFENENQIKVLIDRLNSIETKQGKLDCLQYTLMNGYNDIFPERYRKTSTKKDKDIRNLFNRIENI